MTIKINAASRLTASPIAQLVAVARRSLKLVMAQGSKVRPYKKTDTSISFLLSSPKGDSAVDFNLPNLIKFQRVIKQMGTETAALRVDFVSLGSGRTEIVYSLITPDTVGLHVDTAPVLSLQ